MGELFGGAQLKINRALTHISQIEHELGLVSDSKPYKLVVEEDERTGDVIASVKIDDGAMDVFSVLVGDVIHNLRASLDHLVWELVGKDHGKLAKSVQFCCGAKNASDLKNEIKNRIKMCRPDTIQFLNDIESHEAGKNKNLVILHNLDVADKHHAVVPLFAVASIRNGKVLHADGTPALTFNEVASNIGVDGKARIIVIDRGMKFEFNSNTDAVTDIFFQEAGLEGKPIIATLSCFAENVSQVRQEFIEFVKNR